MSSFPAGEADVSTPSVLLVCLSIHFGGADVRVLQTARALQRRGWRYRVAVIAGSRLEAALREEGLAAYAVSHRRGDPRILRELIRLISRLKTAVVDAHNPQSLYFAGLASVASGVPRKVATAHSVYSDIHSKPPRRQIHEGALRFSRLIGARFIAVSDYVRDDLVRLGVSQDRIALSRNGVEPLGRRPEPIGARNLFGWPEDAFVLSVFARLEPVKGHAFLLEALARLRREGETRPRLLIVGRGGLEERLREDVARLGLSEQVRFLGFRTDVPSILEDTDLVCLPSLGEGLPYTLLEAGRQGVPCLATPVGELGRLFEDGRTILFAPPGDPAALAAKIAAALRSPGELEAIGAASRSLVETRFSVERMIEETLRVYRGEPPPA